MAFSLADPDSYPAFNGQKVRRTKIRFTENVSSGTSVKHTFEGPYAAIYTITGNLMSVLAAGWQELEGEHTQTTVPVGSIAPEAWTEITVTYKFEPGLTDPRAPGTDGYGLIQRTWGRRSNHIQGSILACPNALLLASYQPQWPLRIKQVADAYVAALNKWSADAIAYTLAHSGTPPSTTPADAGAAFSCTVLGLTAIGGGAFVPTDPQYALGRRLFDLLTNQPDLVYSESQFVLVKQLAITANAIAYAQAAYLSDADVGKLFTYTQLTTAEPTLPGAVLLDTAELVGLYWQKQEPQLNVSNAGTYQIEQEYWGVGAAPGGGLPDAAAFMYGAKT